MFRALKTSPQKARAFCGDRFGGVAVMFAVYLPLAVMCLALAVDYVLLHIEKRAAQGVVDIAAIIAAEQLTGQEAAARNILGLNAMDSITDIELGRIEDEEEYEEAVETRSRVNVVTGRYEADPDIPAADRFTPGGSPYNAARVTITKKGALYFARGFVAAPEMSVTATARRREMAAFSVGARLASVDDGVLNALFGDIAGADVSLSVLDYEALLDTEVDVFAFLDALASGVDIRAGDYDNILDSDPELRDVLDAIIEASGYGPAASALTALNGHSGVFRDNVNMRRVINLGPAGAITLGEADEKGFPATVSAFDLLFANMVAANGDHLIELDLTAAAPGLASLTATLELGEQLQSSPWLAVGQRGETASNVQARLLVEGTVGGTGLLSGVEIRLPAYFEIARAEGELLSVDCPAGVIENATVRLSGISAAAEGWIGDVDMTSSRRNDDPVRKAKIVSSPGLVAFADSHVVMASGDQETLEFSWRDITDGVVKSTQADTALSALIDDILDAVDIEVRVLGLGLSSEGLADAALRDALGTLSAPVGDAVDTLLAALGVSVGEGDFRVNGVKCDRAVLVE